MMNEQSLGYEAARALLSGHYGPGAATSAAICVRTPERTITAVLAAEPGAAEYAPDASFILYSIAKTCLATIALRLVARGILTLDRPIDHWLPHAPHASDITLRQLLRHSSGLPDYGGLAVYHEAVRRGDAPWSDDEYFARARADQLLFPPGQGWRYSNIGYLVVRRLLEAVQQAPLAAIVATEICAPLGLAAMKVLTRDEELRPLVFAPSVELGSEEHPVAVAERYHLGWVAHGVFASTVEETAAFVAALFAGRLLAPNLLREMCTATPLPVMPGRPFRRPGYGLGLQIDTGWSTMVLYGHTGGGPGAHIYAVHGDHPTRPVTVVVATPGEDIAQCESLALALLVGEGLA